MLFFGFDLFDQASFLDYLIKFHWLRFVWSLVMENMSVEKYGVAKSALDVVKDGTAESVL